MLYVDVEASELDCPAGEVGGTDGGGGGRRENRDGDGEMKERYWSTTWGLERVNRLQIAEYENTHLLYEFSRSVLSY